MPKLWMANDVVIQIGEIAEQMFFIYKGTAVVFATDNSTVIAYLNEGSYFGEIGVLITKIRTVTVKAFTLCIFYVIHKNDLLRILELYPDQMEFLQAVGRQRMLTTNLEDIMEDFENNALDANEEKLLSNSNCYNSNNRSMNIAKEKIKWNMTLEFPKSKNFIIIPFSKLYYIWNSIIVILLMYELLFIPFSISFEYEFNIFTLLFDILWKFIFAFDIFMASKTGFNNKFEITVDLKEISKDYIETRLILDALWIIPLDLIIRIFVENDQSVAFWRIIQLIKIYKLYDYLTIWRKYYLGKRNFWYIFFMVFVFIYLAHLNACIFYFIGKFEVDRHDRFDGQCLFSDIINRNFLTLSPVLEMSLLEKYCHFMYLGAWTVGGTIYGDIIPYAMSEQLFNQVTTFLSRIVVAFIYAQASGYISSIYMMYSNHIESKNMLIEYLEIHNMPSDMKKRVNKYYEILWNNFKGINDREIMIDLPENINKEIKLFVFTSFIEKFTIFPKEENAAITSLLARIKISLVPKGEYIIREREIRDCIYFIIRGSVLIISGEIILATLEQGAIFGEMAIAEKIPTVRNASAFWVTHSWIGSWSIDDYNIICHSYPSFEEEIQNEIQRRKIANLTKTPNIKQKSSTNILPNIERKNKENKLELNFKTSKDSSEFSNIESSQAILKAEEDKQDSKIEENFIQLNHQPLYLKRKETESNSKENQNEEIISKNFKNLWEWWKTFS